MSAEPVPVAPAGPGRAAPRPALFVIRQCDGCSEQVAVVRDRDGKPVQLALGGDGKARRDPAGGWWAAKFGDAWRVVCPQPDEDPPTSGGGVRYVEHSHRSQAEQLLHDRLGAQPHAAAEARVAGVPVRPAGVSSVASVVGPRSGLDDRYAGMCVGRCGAVLAGKYGPFAQTMCEGCAAVLAAWRESPGPYRSAIPFGRWADGVYVGGELGANPPVALAP